jgi:hypothetical protein
MNTTFIEQASLFHVSSSFGQKVLKRMQVVRFTCICLTSSKIMHLSKVATLIAAFFKFKPSIVSLPGNMKFKHTT